MSALAVTLTAETASYAPTKIQSILRQMDGEDQIALTAALNDRDPGGNFRVSAARLAGILSRAGHPIGATAIKTYRATLA